MIRSSFPPLTPTVTFAVVTDPTLLAELTAQRQQSDRNAAWLQSHATEVYSHRGKFFCIAGEELFVADTAEKAIAEARAKHPGDKGYLFRYIPVERLPRV